MYRFDGFKFLFYSKYELQQENRNQPGVRKKNENIYCAMYRFNGFKF